MKSSKTGQELFKTIGALFKTAQLFEEALFEWPETETGNLKKPEEETSDKKKNGTDFQFIFLAYLLVKVLLIHL